MLYPSLLLLWCLCVGWIWVSRSGRRGSARVAAAIVATPAAPDSTETWLAAKLAEREHALLGRAGCGKKEKRRAVMATRERVTVEIKIRWKPSQDLYGLLPSRDYPSPWYWKN